MAERVLEIAVLVVAAASLAALVWVVDRIRTGRAILPHEARRLVPWGMAEVLIVAALTVFLPAIAVLLSGVKINPERGLAGLPESELILVLLLTGAARIVAFVAGMLVLVFGSRATTNDLGVERISKNLGRDFRIAIVGLCAGVIPVFALQIVLTRLFPKGHQVIEAVQQQQIGLGLALATLFSVVIAAPLLEEFVFRLVLQGWLERIDRWLAPTAAERREASRAGGHLRGETMLPPDVVSPDVAQEPTVGVPSQPPSVGVSHGVMPVAVSSLVFAAMHIGQGPAPISLIPLAIILGYVYYRTHRLVPCIILHASFNLLNMVLLWLAMEAGQKL